MKKFLFALTGLAVLAACGSSQSFSGSVGGNSLNAKEAVMYMADNTAFVLLSDQTGLCNKFKANQLVKNATGLLIQLAMHDAQLMASMPTTGTYTVLPVDASPTTPGLYAYSSFDKTNATCASVYGQTPPTATSGTVKVTSLSMTSGGHTNGTYDMNFKSDHVTGGFEATMCDAPVPTTTGTCN